MFSTKLFNIRLYLEGLKRLKVIGMAVAILSVTVSALIPFVYWLDLPRDPSLTVIKTNEVCIPIFGVIFLAPLFFVVLFSFLHKRKESDFFHAIPYTRTCVYLSFGAAALTFIAAIMTASVISAGIIWGLNPYTTFDLGSVICVALMCFLAAAELSAIMMLALSLTGTPTTTFLMFALFTLFTRLIMMYFANIIDDNMSIIDTNDMPFFKFTWFLPFGMFMYAVSNPYYLSFNPLQSPANIIYTIIVTVLLFAAAWFFYKIRKSEMAGNTAPNRVAQHIFRILFTLPFALLIPLFLLLEDDMDFALFLVLSVITLLVYYLYELITTKRFKGFGMATALLPVLLVACLSFAGVYACIEYTLFEKSPDDPQKVAAVNIEADYQTNWDDYQEYLLKDCYSSDPEVINAAVKQMNLTVKGDRDDNHFEKYAGYGARSWITIRFKMSNGAIITRQVLFNDNDLKTMQKNYVNTVQVDTEAFWALPDVQNITYIYGEMNSNNGYSYHYVDFSGENESKMTAFYKILEREYNALSSADKEIVRYGSYHFDMISSQEPYYSLNINGTFPSKIQGSGRGRYFSLTLQIYEDLLPETFAYLNRYSISYY